jgi:hypothetical protein
MQGRRWSPGPQLANRQWPTGCGFNTNSHDMRMRVNWQAVQLKPASPVLGWSVYLSPNLEGWTKTQEALRLPCGEGDSNGLGGVLSALGRRRVFGLLDVRVNLGVHVLVGDVQLLKALCAGYSLPR